MALKNAAHVIFLIDGRTEITGADRDLATMLRKLGKPVVLAVNKIDSPKREDLAHEFHSLGFKDLFRVSAEHHLGSTICWNTSRRFRSERGAGGGCTEG